MSAKRQHWKVNLASSVNAQLFADSSLFRPRISMSLRTLETHRGREVSVEVYPQRVISSKILQDDGTGFHGTSAEIVDRFYRG